MPGKGKPFEPGWDGGPGRPVLSPEQKQIKTLAHHQVSQVAQMVLCGRKEDLLRVATDPDSSPLEIAMAVCVADAIQKKKWDVIETLLDRFSGKPAERIKVDIEITRTEIIEVTEKLKALRSATGKP